MKIANEVYVEYVIINLKGSILISDEAKLREALKKFYKLSLIKETSKNEIKSCVDKLNNILLKCPSLVSPGHWLQYSIDGSIS